MLVEDTRLLLHKYDLSFSSATPLSAINHWFHSKPSTLHALATTIPSHIDNWTHTAFTIFDTLDGLYGFKSIRSCLLSKHTSVLYSCYSRIASWVKSFYKSRATGATHLYAMVAEDSLGQTHHYVQDVAHDQFIDAMSPLFPEVHHFRSGHSYMSPSLPSIQQVHLFQWNNRIRNWWKSSEVLDRVMMLILRRHRMTKMNRVKTSTTLHRRRRRRNDGRCYNHIDLLYSVIIVLTYYIEVII